MEKKPKKRVLKAGKLNGTPMYVVTKAFKLSKVPVRYMLGSKN